jgi:hypothetical protein
VRLRDPTHHRQTQSRPPSGGSLAEEWIEGVLERIPPEPGTIVLNQE